MLGTLLYPGLIIDMRPFEYLVQDDFFSKNELDCIWNEISNFWDLNLFKPPSTYNSDYDKDTKLIIKNNNSFFLHDYYSNLSDSSIVKATDKIINNAALKFSGMCFANRSILNTNRSTFLVSYYSNNNDYKLHKDNAVTTALYWLCVEPKAFTGGDLYFSDLDEWVEFKSNRLVMFPSQALHSVSPLVSSENIPKGLGRYCITQFFII